MKGQRGVTDGNGKIQGIDSLYVTGSSNFTTGGGVNPTMIPGGLINIFV